MGDTAFAIELLRRQVTPKSPPAEQCLLATLIARTVTKKPEDWKARHEAETWFERALRERNDPVCLLEYAGLKERQGIRVDASRLAHRAFRMIGEDTSLQTPAVMAEVYYRRALPIAEWIRYFDHLVFVPDLPVSTPSCAGLGAFCESLAHPDDFRGRLERAPRADDLVADKRAVLQALVDSALAFDPTHQGALRLALREAALAGNWERYGERAALARRAAPDDVGALLALLSAHVVQGNQAAADAVFDTVMRALGPDAMARYEGLALVADSSVRDRLRGQEQVVYGEAVWGLSDPLYLTPHNERRQAHYARIVLAEVLFTDPPAGVAGRDTPQGRLLIRYGLPLERYVVQADRRRILTPEQRAVAAEVLACAITLDPRTTDKDGACVIPGGGNPVDAGGRWEFWYYGESGPPFIFERAPGSAVARHMFETRSRELDSALHRAIPSSFQPPFERGRTVMLVTAFPRPDTPSVEVWARFATDGAPARGERADLGVFLHDRTTGREVARRVLRRPASSAPFVFGYEARPGWGRFQIAAEGALRSGRAADQARAEVDLRPPRTDQLVLSGLLLADSIVAPVAFDRRDQLDIRPRADTVLPPGAPLALYWEIYGLQEGPAHYRVQLAVRDAEDRPFGASAIRALGRLLGVTNDVNATIEWEVRRPGSAAVVPEVVTLTLPSTEGMVRLRITVEDLRTSRRETAHRIVELRSR